MSGKDNVYIGNVAEAKVLPILVSKFKTVFIPFGSGSKSDFIVETNSGDFLRIQVKSARIRKGCVSANSYSQSGTTKIRTFYKDIDLFVFNFLFLISKLFNIIWRQSALILNKYLFNINQRLYVEDLKFYNKNYIPFEIQNAINLFNKVNFYMWLVGFTDGVGSFSIHNSISSVGKSRWTLIFKIGQSSYNLRALYFIKKKLGFGSIYIESKSKMANFFIRDRKVIEKIIFPIFDKYPLLTSKYFDYIKFKNAHSILIDPLLSKEEKNKLILLLKNESKSDNFISPVWNKINNIVENTDRAKEIISKSWLIGFTEAEGSFYIVKKDSLRLVHGFEITQKLDLLVLEGIAKILGISITKNKKYNTIVTTNSRAIQNIINYYKDTMKGMKTVEYKIWAKSFLKHKGNYYELNKTRELMRKIRSIRCDINGKIKKS